MSPSSSSPFSAALLPHHVACVGLPQISPPLVGLVALAYVVASANVQEKQSQAVSAVFADKGNVPDLGW